MAHSLLQSKLPEAGVSASQSLCFPRGQVGLGGRSPRSLPLSLGDLGSRRSTGPACSDPKRLGWGGGGPFSALMSTSILQTSAHVSVCPGSSPIRRSAASPVPARCSAAMRLLPCLSAPQDWAPDVFISRTSSWLAQSVLSMGLQNQV